MNKVSMNDLMVTLVKFFGLEKTEVDQLVKCIDGYQLAS